MNRTQALWMVCSSSLIFFLSHYQRGIPSVSPRLQSFAHAKANFESLLTSLALCIAFACLRDLAGDAEVDAGMLRTPNAHFTMFSIAVQPIGTQTVRCSIDFWNYWDRQFAPNTPCGGNVCPRHKRRVADTFYSVWRNTFFSNPHTFNYLARNIE